MKKDQILPVLYALALAISTIFMNREFYHDDAYITLRYARNFIDGMGIIWNPGERLQGYTNFLHLIMISLLGRFGIGLVNASQMIGFLAYLGLVVSVALFAKTLEKDNDIQLWHLPVIIVATSSPILVWMLGGLEGILFSFLVAAGCLLIAVTIYSNENRWFYCVSGLSLGLSYLTRPDGIVFIAVSTGYLFWLALKRRTKVSSFITFIAGCALPIFPYTIWQFYYYGDIFPATFYAKIGIPIGIKLYFGAGYILRYLFDPPFLVLITSILLVYVLLKRSWIPQLTFLSLLVLAYLIYVTVGAGGDHMPAFRLILPTIPLMSAMMALAIPQIFDLNNTKTVNYITFVVMVLISFQLIDSTVNPVFEDPASHVGTAIGKYIATVWPANSLIALNTAGSIPYYAGSNRYIDMLGLNDITIAKRHIEKISFAGQMLPGHFKGDGAYVLSRKPDYIIIGPAQGTIVTNPFFLSDFELSKDQHFLQDYASFTVPLDSNGYEDPTGEIIFMYYKRITEK